MTLAIATAGGFLPPAVAIAQVPAFPGAEGHGRFTTGGRGGNIVHVTNLDDSGRGSLRWALMQPAPRTIVFDVGGYIDLKSPLEITSNTTIAGQTAPAPGITLRYNTVSCGKCHDTVIRFIRVRRSQVKNASDEADAIWGTRRRNVIIDHCSFSWGIDEIASFYDNNRFTMQWCLMGEGLDNAGHSKGSHGYGGIWGGKGASFHHNMIVHVQDRIPLICGARYGSNNFDSSLFQSTVDAERLDLRNNLYYNWGRGGSRGGAGGGYVNLVNNIYKPGAATKSPMTVTNIGYCDPAADFNVDDRFAGLSSRYWIKGNAVVRANSRPVVNHDWKGVVADKRITTIDGDLYSLDPGHLYGDTVTYVKNADGIDCVKIRLDSPIDAGTVTTHEALTAHSKVLAYSGACLWRDEADTRYAEEARTMTTTYIGPVSLKPGIVDTVNDPEAAETDLSLPSYPTLAATRRPEGFDTDGDGIADDWERANGLDPTDASDASATTLDPRGWYTNLEVYLNSLVEEIVKAGNADADEPVDEYFPAWTAPAAGIGGIAAEPARVVAVEYYSMTGTRLEEPDAAGIFVRRTLFSDHTSKTEKIIKTL